MRAFYGRLAARVNAGEMTAGTAHKVATTLSGIMSEAVESSGLASIPAIANVACSGQAPRRARPLSSRAEVERVVDATDPKYKQLVRLSAYTGRRQGEVLALQRRHVNLLRGEVRVERAVKAWSDGRAVCEPTRTGNARTVGLAPNLKAEMSAHLDNLRGGPDALVFRSAGERLWLSTWRRNHWRRAVNEALGERDVRPHDLRHTRASWLIAGGANVKEVMEWLGHASVQMTLGAYGHLFPNAMGKLAETLDALDAEPTDDIAVDG